MEEAKREFHTKLETANADHKKKYDQLNDEKEELRKQRDA